MSFCGALQSFVFYLASCTPCLQAKHHRQTKAEAKKERRVREHLRAQNPGMYQQPDPFNTNPYWSEEIMMGPHLPARKYSSMGSKNNSQRGLASAGKDTVTSATPSTTAVEHATFGSSPTVVNGTDTFSLNTSISDDWNRKRYQREDEELWGHEWSRAGSRLVDAIRHAGNSAGRRIEAGLGKEPREITNEDRHNFYFAAKHPPVNDYHPPIVSQRPTRADNLHWMLQPPPSAKVMEGKVPVSRTASMASHLSRKTTASGGADLNRMVRERAMEAKLQSGEFPPEIDVAKVRNRPMSGRRRTTSSHSHDSKSSFRLSRSISMDDSDASEELVIEGRRRISARAKAVHTPVSGDLSSSEEDYFLPRSSQSLGRRRLSTRRPTSQIITSPSPLTPTTPEVPRIITHRTPSSPLADSTNTISPSRAKPPATSITPIDELPSVSLQPSVPA